MLKHVTPCIFSPEGNEAGLDRRVISGGTAIDGAEDVIATDGGGHWFVEISDPYLDEPPVAKAWRALSGYLDSGATPIILSLCDARHQPTNGFLSVPHSDGSPFSDDTEYQQADSEVTVAADAGLRATTLNVAIALLPEPLLGGERFSIDHPFMRDRPYEIIEILAQDEESATLRFRPPLREAVTSGTNLNFADPRCVVRLDGAMRSPTTLGFMESPGARFVEHFPGKEGYL